MSIFVADDRHESTKNAVEWLSGGEHLPEEIRDIWNLHETYVAGLLAALPEDGIEFSARLRKLLEAKDRFIRHAVKTRGLK